MSIPGKLPITDDFRQNLSNADSDVTSPGWHGDVLSERERLIESGEEIGIDWEIASEQLLAELQSSL